VTPEQEKALRALCGRYNVKFSPDDFRYAFGLPKGYIAGQVGPIYVGCDLAGRISS
jgi:hypothetical protein